MTLEDAKALLERAGGPYFDLGQFATQIVAAMNAAKIVPCGNKDDLCAMMVVIGSPDEDAPFGGSINYEWDKGIWELSLQLEVAEKVAERIAE